MKIRSLTAILLGAALATTSVACTRSESDAPPTPVSIATVTEFLPESPQPVTPVTTDPVTNQPSTDTEIPIEEYLPPTDCELAELDLGDTGFGVWLDSRIIPTSEVGTLFYVEEINEQFNPCSELSHVTLLGRNGTAGSLPGPGQVDTATTVFFNFEELITEPAPIQFPAVPSVERINDRALEVVYVYFDGTPEGGDTERLPIQYRMDGEQLLGDELIPARQQGNLRLDLSRAGVPGVGAAPSLR